MTEQKRLVMVCGAARSGTTMLDLMLGNTDAAFSCGEIYALFRPFRTHHFEPLCSCGDPQCEVWSDLRHSPEAEFHQRVLQLPGIDFAVDSSKDLRWVVNSNEWATAAGIAVDNVLIWKDPIDLAHSHWKRGRPIGYFRKQFLDYYERFLDLNLPFFSVSYGRLVAEPRVLLQQVCEELGMPYFEGKEEFWHKTHHHFFGSAGTARQVDKGSSTVGLRRDFPAEFRREWDTWQRSAANDGRLQSVVERLEAMDVGRADRAADSGYSVPAVRPVWYYRHIVKALFRKHFPERARVLD